MWIELVFIAAQQERKLMEDPDVRRILFNGVMLDQRGAVPRSARTARRRADSERELPVRSHERLDEGMPASSILTSPRT